VDSVNRTPGENPPEAAQLLPAIPRPTKFEVASVKPSDRSQNSLQMQPGGSTAQGVTLRFFISRALNVSNSDPIVGLPKWVDDSDPRLTGRPFQNEIPHRGATGSSLLASGGEAQDEHGQSGKPHILQNSAGGLSRSN
jgi:hypothetical protein